MVKKGIDISSAQGTISIADWQTLANNDIYFCIIEAYIGNDGASSDYTTYKAGAEAAGIKTLPYNFLYPIGLPSTTDDPNRDAVAQAQLHFSFCKSITCCDLEWPIASDWATWGCSAIQIVDWVNQYMETYKSLSGAYPILYTYPDYMMTLGYPSSFANYKLWIASYVSVPDIPMPWKKDGYSMWQTSGGGLALPNGALCDTDICIDGSIFGSVSVPAPSPNPPPTSAVNTLPVVSAPVVVPAPVPVPIPAPTPVPVPLPAPQPISVPIPSPSQSWWQRFIDWL